MWGIVCVCVSGWVETLGQGEVDQKCQGVGVCFGGKSRGHGADV